MITIWDKNLAPFSRREYPHIAEWYKSSSLTGKSTLVVEDKPSASFVCKQVNAFANRDTRVSTSFLVSESAVQIETPNNLPIEDGDKIKFKDRMWVVQYVQRIETRRTINGSISEKLVLSLRGGSKVNA